MNKSEKIPLDYKGKPDITKNMKPICIGEFAVDVSNFDEEGRNIQTEVLIPWTTMKEIYKKMAEIAISDFKL